MGNLIRVPIRTPMEEERPEETVELPSEEELPEESTPEELRAQLERAKRMAKIAQEKYLRVLADRENYRKRIENIYNHRLRERERDLLLGLLQVADNLERALQHARPGDPLAEGVALVYRQLLDLLRREDVKQMETIGKSFDPRYHDAVEVVSSDAEAGTIIREEQKGYLQGEETLRPARVIVSG